MINVVKNFYEALHKFEIKYDEETGRLSKTLVIIAYKTERKVEVDRVFLFEGYFLIFYEKDVRKVRYENVIGFQLKTEIIR